MKTGLSLAGGGAKGSYQIGAYLAFMECHIKFDGIVGTSIGAANGAVIASGNYKKLLDAWKKLDPGELLNVSTELIDYVNDGNFNFKTVKGILKTSKYALKNHGFNILAIKDLINSLVNIKKLKSNKIDYGLVTYNFTKKEPLYIFKEDIPESSIIDYIIASCSLPIFRLDNSINNDLYIDGGFYDNCPSIMLINKHYDLIYEVKINGIGINKFNNTKNSKIILISPTRDNGSIFEMNHKKIIDNIYMGYFDTLKVLGKYYGFKYNFKKTVFVDYNKLLNKFDKFTRNRIIHFFNDYNAKRVIYKAVEYVMEKENYDYNKIYNFKRVVITIPVKYNFVYEFVKDLFK